jgi:putative transposase
LNWSGNTLKKMNWLRHLFDDELELGYAVIHGVEVRGQRGNYTTQRLKFNSN